MVISIIHHTNLQPRYHNHCILVYIKHKRDLTLIHNSIKVNIIKARHLQQQEIVREQATCQLVSFQLSANVIPIKDESRAVNEKYVAKNFPAAMWSKSTCLLKPAFHKIATSAAIATIPVKNDISLGSLKFYRSDRVAIERNVEKRTNF